MSRGATEYVFKLIDLVSGPLKNLAVQADVVWQKMADANSRYGAGVKTVANTIDQLKYKIENLQKIKGSLINEADIRKTNAEIKKLTSELQRLENLPPKGFFANMGSLKSSLQGLGGVVAGVFAFESIKNFAGSLIETGSRMEQTRIAFQTLLQDKTLANAKMKEIQAFADKSPFSTSESYDAAQSLLAFGLSHDKLIDRMGKLGDISQGNSVKFKSMVDNYGKVLSAQRANTVDMNQFAIAGIPVWQELGKILGIQGKELRYYVEQNGVSVSLVDQIMDNLTKKGGQFFGMMEAQSQSTAGKWSTFTSKLEATAVKVFDKLQPYINKVIDLGTAYLPKVERALAAIFNVFKQGYKFIKDHETLLKSLAVVVGGLTVAWFLNNVQMTLASGLFSGLTFVQGLHFGLLLLCEKATTAWAAAQARLNLAFLANPLTWVVVAIAAVAAAVYYAWNTFEGFRGFLFGLWESIKTIFGNIAKVVSDTFMPVLDAIRFFKEGKYAEAAKSIGKVALGVSMLPVNIAANAANGVGKAFETGYGKGVADFKADKAAQAAGKKADPLAAIKNQLTDTMGGDGSKPKLPIDTSVTGDSGKSRIVNLRIDKIEVNNRLDAGSGDFNVLRSIRDGVAETLVAAARDAELILSNG